MKKQLTKLVVGVLFLILASFSQAAAGQITVSVKNLTNGIYFTPLLITAHNAATDLFETGESASAALQAMAEGGDISGLTTQVGGADADTIENPAGGLLGPGDSTVDVMLNTATGNDFLSIVAMLLPTNDGFVGMDSLPIPSVPGTYKYFLLGYDAGTEANDERITGGGAPGVPGIPFAPADDGGTKGKGVTDFESNTTVHVHRGVIGDEKRKKGISDLFSSIHRWLNPVAEVTIVVAAP